MLLYWTFTRDVRRTVLTPPVSYKGTVVQPYPPYGCRSVLVSNRLRAFLFHFLGTLHKHAFLAMTVLLDIVAAAMPKSNSIPLLGYYIISVIILCALGVGLSMALLAVSRSLIQMDKMPSEFAYKMMCMRRKKRPVDYWETTPCTDFSDVFDNPP